MARLAKILGTAALVAASAAPATAQDHDHAAGTPEHSHAGAAVDCTTLASPPWTGLPESDRSHVATLQRSLAELATPEAARAAGFSPALGDIPGMGVHYVHSQRMVDGIQLDAPDHLLFATIDGEERLVGAAYAFRDVPETDVPIPFQSDLAHWHDHPQFAGPGQTLHMLHVWFIPSSNGPFAGLNFWLPFRSAGITPPSACWMADPQSAEVIQQVSFALAPRQWGNDGATVTEPSANRSALLAELDAAARADSYNDWFSAAERFLADLTPAERAAMQATLQALSMAQMSTAEREAGQN